MSSYFIHNRHGTSMSPKAIVNRDECETGSLTKQRRQHHVTRVKRMDEIGWKRIFLLHYIRFLVQICRYAIVATHLFRYAFFIVSIIRLDDRQTQRRRPLHILTTYRRYMACALREPVLNLFGGREHLTQTLKCFGGQIGGGGPNPFFRKAIYIFKLPADLQPGPISRNTVNSGHNRLFDYFALNKSV